MHVCDDQRVKINRGLMWERKRPQESTQISFEKLNIVIGVMAEVIPRPCALCEDEARLRVSWPAEAV